MEVKQKCPRCGKDACDKSERDGEIVYICVACGNKSIQRKL